jgi:hypothetical protein
MPRPLQLVALVLLCSVALAANGAPPPPLLGENHTVSLSLAQSDFPDASLVDLGLLRDQPTGKHGDMFCGTDGHFYYQDGTRGRFWGLNIAKGSVFVPQPLIDQAIAAIDRAGFNLVRFHHLDDVQGLLPADTAGTAERLDEAKLALLDYWIAELGKRGIYVYLDLLDYRTFYEKEGVAGGESLGRGAKPYAFFDRKLIALQQQYARKLLVEHINPYTRLSYAQDPTVCLVELCDENGLFIRAKDWASLVSPYREDLQRRWNEWLTEKYGDTATLAEAWTDADGHRGLRGDEKLEQGSVRLFPPPGRADFPSPTPTRTGEPEEGQTGRTGDRRLFFVDMHEDYFKTMRTYLRNHGVRQPISAVTDFTHLSDLRSVSAQLDYVGVNFYYDHPLWQKGNEWKLPAIFSNANPLSDTSVESIVPRVCSSRIAGKPLVIREWNVCWPNRYRAAGMMEAAVYGAVQDWDAMILFTYDIRPGQKRAEFFDVRTDPVRWGAASLGAAVFLRRLVSPAKRKTAVAYSAVDTHYPTYQPFPTEIYKLGWTSQVATLFFEQKLENGPDLVLASGRCNGGAYPGSRVVLCGNWPAMDLLDHQRGQSADQLSGYDVATVPEKGQDFLFGGTMFDAGSRRRMTASPGYLLADVQAQSHLRPIGVGEDGEACLGFRDMTRQNYVFRQLNAVYQLRVALDALNHIYDEGVSHNFVDSGRYLSDTGQVRRILDPGVLQVNAPQAQIICGDLRAATWTKTNGFALTTASPLGVVAWLSLDRKPLKDSQRWLLRMITNAANHGEQRSLHQNNSVATLYALTDLGQGPADSGGQPCDTPTVVTAAGQPLLRVFMINGAWELAGEGGDYHFACDTPGVRVEFPRLNPQVKLTVIRTDGTSDTRQATQPLVFPEGASYITVRNW